MKILKLPIDETKIKCECGCEFEFNAEDVILSTMFANNIEYNTYHIHCPFCKKVHDLHTRQKERQYHCGDCEHCIGIAEKDEMTQEWVPICYRCQKFYQKKSVGLEDKACEDFKERR